MRAISLLSLEAGTSSFWWRARIELRMRVRKSATGSVKFIEVLLHSPFAPALVRRENQRKCLLLVSVARIFSRHNLVVAHNVSTPHYQLDFTTPGISPLSASERKH